MISLDTYVFNHYFHIDMNLLTSDLTPLYEYYWNLHTQLSKEENTN